MTSMKLFAQIQKVDEEKRLVFGRAADETPDKSGEMLNYDGSKPHFVKWSEDLSKDTDGKSLGNLRAMHGKVAAGVLKDIQFDDSARTINVCAKVVDDNEWKKVLEGVYTGFSIGGSYGEKSVEKVADKEYTRYVAIPSEISLVDRPCIPTAKFFQVQKADGSTADVEFKPALDLEKEGGAVDVTGTPEEIIAFGKLMNDKGLTMAEVIEMVKIAARDDTSAEAGKKEYGDVEFADTKNKKYPLDTEAHVRAAASYFGMDKNRGKYSAEDQKTIDSKIAAAKERFKVGDDEASKAETVKVMKVLVSGLRKGMYECAQFAQIIGAMQNLMNSAAYESYREGDDSPVPQALGACIQMCAGVLKQMIDEEVSEAGGDEEMPQNVMQMAEHCGALAKYEGEHPLLTLVKYGARHGAGDKALVEGIHKASVDLGADCQPAAKADVGDLHKAEDGVLAKMVAAAIEPLQKSLFDAQEQIKKLEAEPRAPKVSLRAVSKANDDGGFSSAQPTETDLVKDAHGAVHPAASLIKQQFATGGQPMVYRG